MKGSDDVVASSPIDGPAAFDLSAGAPLGLKGLAEALKTMKKGEKAHLKLKPECECLCYLVQVPPCCCANLVCQLVCVTCYHVAFSGLLRHISSRYPFP